MKGAEPIGEVIGFSENGRHGVGLFRSVFESCGGAENESCAWCHALYPAGRSGSNRATEPAGRGPRSGAWAARCAGDRADRARLGSSAGCWCAGGGTPGAAAASRIAPSPGNRVFSFVECIPRAKTPGIRVFASLGPHRGAEDGGHDRENVRVRRALPTVGRFGSLQATEPTGRGQRLKPIRDVRGVATVQGSRAGAALRVRRSIECDVCDGLRVRRACARAESVEAGSAPFPLHPSPFTSSATNPGYRRAGLPGARARRGRGRAVRASGSTPGRA